MPPLLDEARHLGDWVVGDACIGSSPRARRCRPGAPATLRPHDGPAARARAELRAAGRQDLVKAVEGHGGFCGVENEQMDHEAKVVEEGTKIVINAWFDVTSQRQ